MSWTFRWIIDWYSMRVPVVAPNFGRWPAIAVFSVLSGTIIVLGSSVKGWWGTKANPNLCGGRI